MLMFSIVAILLFCSVYAYESNFIEDDKLWLNSLQDLLRNKTEDDAHFDSRLFNPEKHVKFLLYTRQSKNNCETLKIGDVESVKKSYFDKDRDTKIVVHGWMSSAKKYFGGELKDAYLSTEDVNVITVEWPAYSVYFLAKAAVTPVASVVTKFLDFLVHDIKVETSRIHLLGHSLGAHVVGIGAKNMKDGRVARVTGFDPAAPLFTKKDKSGRIDKSDADFVDIIHTSGGYLGFLDPLGHVDFYPNGGTPVQPGCGFDIGSCSHCRSYMYYIEAITSNGLFMAVPCNNYNDFKNAKCCTGVINMGPSVNQKARGTYYLQTGDSSPFALGKDSIVAPCWWS